MKFFPFLIAFFLLFLAIFSHGNAQLKPSTQLQIVATDSIIADWIKNISNNTLHLTTLVGPDTDNHTFEPTPRDGVSLSKANIIFENGLGLEFWLNGLYKSSKSKAQRIALSSYVNNLLKANCHGHAHCNHGHDYDPHTWLDVNNVILMVQTIKETLVKEDPENAQTYQILTAKYIDELKKLDVWIFEQVSKIPPANRKLITNHNSFAYFAKRYGFTILGDILGSTSTDNIDPSAGHFKNLIKIIRKHKVPAIFGENIQNNALINKLAQETHLPQPKILYTESLSKESGPARSYVDLMKYNVETMVESLK